MKEAENNKAIAEKYEMFCDSSYFGLWCVRRIGSKDFNDTFHFGKMEEAKRFKNLAEKAL